MTPCNCPTRPRYTTDHIGRVIEMCDRCGYVGEQRNRGPEIVIEPSIPVVPHGWYQRTKKMSAARVKRVYHKRKARKAA